MRLVDSQRKDKQNDLDRDGVAQCPSSAAWEEIRCRWSGNSTAKGKTYHVPPHAWRFRSRVRPIHMRVYMRLFATPPGEEETKRSDTSKLSNSSANFHAVPVATGCYWYRTYHCGLHCNAVGVGSGSTLVCGTGSGSWSHRFRLRILRKTPTKARAPLGRTATREAARPERECDRL